MGFKLEKKGGGGTDVRRFVEKGKRLASEGGEGRGEERREGEGPRTETL